MHDESVDAGDCPVLIASCSLRMHPTQNPKYMDRYSEMSASICVRLSMFMIGVPHFEASSFYMSIVCVFEYSITVELSANVRCD